MYTIDNTCKVRYNVVMYETYNTPQTTEFQVYRDGKPDNSFKKKVKIVKVISKAVGLYFARLGYKLASYVIKGLAGTYNEVKRSITLDMVDYRYKTNLRAQYMSGRRTQAILATKRQHGLI